MAEMLKDLLDWEQIMQQPRRAGGHAEVLRVLFKGAKVIAEYSTDDYQGTIAMTYQLADGRFVVLSDYFGSCSGCDSWEEADDEDAVRLCVTLANNAHTFNRISEALVFLASTDGDANYYEWHDTAVPLIGALAKFVSENDDTWGW